MVVNAFLISDWNWYGLLVEGQSLTDAWKNQYFYEICISLGVFFAMDAVWVTWVPSCVRSPRTILTHHAVTLFYLLGPLNYPEYRWMLGPCVSVEINTCFLVLRRLIYKAKSKTGSTSAPSNTVGSFCFNAFAELVSLLFYITWIITRLCVYPTILYILLQLAVEGKHGPLLFAPVHGILCILYAKWSYEIFTPIFGKWVRWGRSQHPRLDHLIASGL
jgi:TLC domain